ncbi:hypothetical protein QQO16_05265 [Limosilactobacillus reuteri]|uniref:Uncharacterized protein n=1 Tax=Limosilactobacillus reuteri subsp. rodentium (strain DSM 17509 / CIP 109821 / 100-23) TaxID=349123 RepID=B3XNZ4_LIMR1|nr:hypothetical protein [Limosilactobacillus reuteri]EDX43530.1 hypothetical protein Lreu23DRAFT_5052 [Limosilactobacillus reuteri subsp. rodentium]MCC4475770.1 hypothetical protein [Limosilactobacillus reuteri]MDL2057466.1 hypothetical protein [Limosilactobacillus reuteri]
MINSYYNDVADSKEYELVELRAIKQDYNFELGFDELEDLDDKIIPLLRKYNLKLEYLKNNPPDDLHMNKWKELKDLKPYPVNEY